MKSDRGREVSHDVPYIWNLKRRDTHELTCKTETNRKRTCDFAREKDGGMVREFGMDVYTLLYLKWITNKDLLYSTGNSAQCYVAACMGGGLGEDGFMYTYG